VILRQGLEATACLHGIRQVHRDLKPEIYICKYDKSVDIWSIGVSAFDIAEGFPDGLDGFSHGGWTAEVQNRVAKAYSKKKGDPFLQLLQEMLRTNPKVRPSANAGLLDHRLEPSRQDDSTI